MRFPFQGRVISRFAAVKNFPGCTSQDASVVGLATPRFLFSHFHGHLEGVGNRILRGLTITMVINHPLTGMILQVHYRSIWHIKSQNLCGSWLFELELTTFIWDRGYLVISMYEIFIYIHLSQPWNRLRSFEQAKKPIQEIPFLGGLFSGQQFGRNRRTKTSLSTPKNSRSEFSGSESYL